MQRTALRLVLLPVGAYIALMFVVALLVQPSIEGWIGFAIVATIAFVVSVGGAYLFDRSRVNASYIHPHVDGARRVIVVVDGTRRATEIRKAIDGWPAEVLVVSPVVAQPLHYVTDDEAGEHAGARTRLSVVLEELTAVGLPAHGVLGPDDPLEALGDALATFPATDVLVVPSEQGSWLERDLPREARDRFGVKVSIV